MRAFLLMAGQANPHGAMPPHGHGGAFPSGMGHAHVTPPAPAASEAGPSEARPAAAIPSAADARPGAASAGPVSSGLGAGAHATGSVPADHGAGAPGASSVAQPEAAGPPAAAGWECHLCGLHVRGADRPSACRGCGTGHFVPLDADRLAKAPGAAFADLAWDPDAEARLERVPAGFMRDMTRWRVEKWARAADRLTSVAGMTFTSIRPHRDLPGIPRAPWLAGCMRHTLIRNWTAL